MSDTEREVSPGRTANRGHPSKSTVAKRSIVVEGHKTSVSLEEPFWTSLKEIASGRRITLSGLVSSIDSDREHGNLSSAVRLFVLDHYRAKTAVIVRHESQNGDRSIALG